MSKISPCLWFDGEAEEAANFYVSLLPDSKIEKVQKNTVDSPAGKAGSVLVVEFTLAGQRFMALNGGKAFDFTHAISVQDRLRRSGRGRSILERVVRGRFGRALRLAEGSLRRVVADRADRACAISRRFDAAGRQRAMQAMMGMVKLDIAGLKQAYEGKPAA
jgi:predicted 3-demethylubiquinone-9 3-methyltransferase (glyoxalase superfamily)